MSKIKVSGSAVTLTSAIKLEDIKFAEQYAREALSLVEERDGYINELFCVMSGAKSSVSKNGIVFARANSKGYAEITQLVDESVKDVTDWVVHNYFEIVTALEVIERQLTDVVKDVKDGFAEFSAKIVTDDAPKVTAKKSR